ncbi:ABC transporter permease [Microbacterium sp. NPDC096154]|uniref:ABC transporter permease n=1 Tax=Microbacterium sp. NPDC096154 TaxID=3155549 RepID=UPI003327911E
MNARRRIPFDIVAAIAIFAVVYGLLLAVAPFERNLYSFSNFVLLLMPLAVAAIGTSTVLITGGADMSVAGMIGLSNVLATVLISAHPEQMYAIMGGVLVLGLLVGLVNGLLVVLLRLQAIAVTLASYIVMTGVALVLLPAPGGSVPIEFTSLLKGSVAGVPTALAVLVVLGLAWSWARRTRAGVTLFAIGNDRQAAVISGLPVRGTEIGAYTFAGFTYALAGLYLTALTASGDPNAGFPFLLTTFAAIALGLVSFRGGKGSAIGALFGAATLTALPKLLFGLGIQDFWSGLIQGLTILLALGIPLVAGVAQRTRTDRRSDIAAASARKGATRVA